MSLINDALKRARQAQTQAPPPVSPGPQLRPVEPPMQSVRKGGLILPLFIAGIVVLVFLLSWNLFRGGSKSESTSIVPMKPERVRASASPQPVSVTPRPNPSAHLEASQTDTNLTVPSLVSKPPLIENVTPSVKAAAATAPATPLKLEGIVFHPTHPAAMIAGKMLFINDKVGDWQGVGISRDSATLSNAGQTNVLSLPQ